MLHATNMRLLLISFIGFYFSAGALAQQQEYRITDDGKYQYLSSRQEAGMVFDESLGTYYKDITVRTFFLETQRKGYLPYYVTYEGFVKLSIAQQRAILKQPHKEKSCSAENMSIECLQYNDKQPPQAPRDPNAKVVDLSPKCTDAAQTKKAAPSLTGKLMTNPNDASVENTDCGEQQPATGTGTTVKTVNVILGKD